MSTLSIAEEPLSVRWSLATRIAFRFAFAYLVLYNLPFPLELTPWTLPVASAYGSLWQMLVVPVAKQFFGIAVAPIANGSSDTSYDYVRLLCMVVVSAMVTLVWSILDRRRLSYTWLHEWLRVYVRFSLAYPMIVYGAIKVIQSQFPSPSLDRLLQPFGDASPMGLLWTFMGASRAYNFITGTGEALGGVLLIPRRTTLLGALLTIVVTGNIVAMNFCYDVPVKLFALHLLLMAVFLVLPDMRRLIEVFFLYRPAPLLRSKWLRAGGIVLGAAVVIAIFWSAFQEVQFGYTYNPSRSPLRGIWNVDTLTVNGVEWPRTDPARWKRIVIDRPEMIAFMDMNDSRTRYRMTLDQTKGALLLKKREDRKWSSALAYRRPDPNSMTIDGAMDGKTYHVILYKSPEPKFRLTTRGFHWINEYPFNR
jgi:hypothetical protein